MEEMIEPDIQAHRRDTKMDSGLFVRYARMWARGRRMITVVMIEVHMGVSVSPLPRMTPMTTCVMLMAT
jgi:hypothetical protein